MILSHLKRATVLVTATLALASGVTITGASPASAAPNFTFSTGGMSETGSRRVTVYNNGVIAGDIDCSKCCAFEYPRVRTRSAPAAR